ncbi:MAG: hypothetical protein KDM63_02675, partial [Verrucomicrobiae bacterium]|nr:hypothetical protein [Verrucomicrobiae bacterium]
MNTSRQIRQMVWLWFTSLGIAMGAVSAAAQEGTDADLPAVEEEEPIIPRAYPEDRYLAIWEKSPFMLEAAPEPVQAQKSFARDYFLAGYVDSNSETVVYLKNQKTGESVRIPPFNKENSEGPDFKFLEL